MAIAVILTTVTTPEQDMTRHTNAMVTASWIGVALGAIAFAVVIAYRTTHHDTAAATPSSTPAVSLLAPTTTTPAMPVDERVACVVLVPTARESADIVLALSSHPDASTIDRDQVAKTMGHLRTAFDLAPDPLRADVRTQLATLEQIDSVLAGRGNRTLHFDDFKASGLDIAARCAPYATR